MLLPTFTRKWVKNDETYEMKYDDLSSVATMTDESVVHKKTMYSIGLKDICNENIFECDILQNEETNLYYLLSKFHDTARHYLQEIGTSNILYLEELPVSSLKIVGNYYEHQELYLKLKKRKEEAAYGTTFKD